MKGESVNNIIMNKTNKAIDRTTNKAEEVV